MMMEVELGGWEASYIAKVKQAKLAKRSDDFTANLVAHVQLHHAHLRRAEHGILHGSHLALVSRVSGPGRASRFVVLLQIGNWSSWGRWSTTSDHGRHVEAKRLVFK